MKRRVITVFLALCMLLQITACKEKQEEIKSPTTEPQVSSSGAIETASSSSIEGVGQTTEPKADISDEDYGVINQGIYTSIGGEMQIKVPEKWEILDQEGVSGDIAKIVGEDYKETKDCITVSVSDKDKELQTYTQQSFEEYFESFLEDFQMKSFEKTEMAGLPVLKLVYTCKTNEGDMVTQYQYMLDGTYTYTINFADVSGTLQEKVEECITSLVIYK